MRSLLSASLLGLSPRALASTLSLALSLALVAGFMAPAAGVAAQPRAFDASAFEASLRPAVRAGLPAAAGLANLGDLTRYELDLGVDIDGGRFSLREHIDYRNDTGAPLGELVLRVYANAVAETAPVTVEHVRCPTVACVVEIAGPSVIVVRPSAPLASGARLAVEAQLSGTLREIDSSRTNLLSQGLEGLATLGSNEHHGDYGLLSRGDGIASLANFYAVVARRHGGAFVRSESSTMGDLGSDDLCNIEARVVVPPEVTVVSTGITESSRVVRDQREHLVRAAAVRDFAVLASRRFAVQTQRVGDVTVRSFFLPEERQTGARVLDVAAHAFGVFERRFGAYPYTELDVVEAPLVGGAGGVEFAGLVTVASMFYRPSGMEEIAALLGGGADRGRMVELVTAHEVAHQWWHGLVGSDSRAHPFVDESLAQWSALLYLEDRYGARRAREDGDAQVKMNYRMMRMMGRPDGAVDRSVDAFRSSLDYAGLIYGKGVYVYPALRRALGDRAFFRGVRRYVQRYRYRKAPRRGLVEVLAEGGRRPRVEAIARHWLDERHGDSDIGGGRAPGSAGAAAGLPSGLGDLGALLGGAGGAGATGASGASGAGGMPSPSELRQLERDLTRMMRELEGAGR